MNKSSLWLFIAAGVLALGGLWYYFMGSPAPEPDQPEVVTAAPPAAPAPAPAGPPPIEHPLPAAPADSPAQPSLPPLADSDGAALAALKSLAGQGIGLFHTDDLVRRFVATVDNLPRERAFTRVMPLKQVPGAFTTDRDGDRLVIGKANEARYAPYVQLAEAVDPRTAAAIYIHFYPLLQEQYRSLGFPDRYFNDRVIAAIDDMLAAPEPRETVALTQPRVLYQFADPELERMSAGRKIMIRMGSANAVRVKQRLRLLRAELTRSPPPR